MKTLQQLEREYFVAKVGGANPTEPLNNIKRRYFVSFLGAGALRNPTTPLSDMEWDWLAKVVTDGGGTVTDDDDFSALWKKAALVAGETPSNYTSDNQRKFYLHTA